MLVRTVALFGVSEGTARVALSRLGAEGEVIADDGSYRLSDRLVERQRAQDETLRPATRPWRGAWEVAVANPGIRAAGDRSTLDSEMRRLRLAELRPGVWVRPDNLLRSWPPEVARRAWRLESRADFEPPGTAEIVAGLWDLRDWAEGAAALIRYLADATQPAWRFELAAAIVRHLRQDPMLPPALLPERWPGPRLRRVYASYRAELGQLISAQRERHQPGSGRAARGSDPAARGSDPAARGSDPAARGSDPAARGSDPAARGSDPAAASRPQTR
jgi:phenylacetic acid degradation operon negative regulatory protein